MYCCLISSPGDSIFQSSLSRFVLLFRNCIRHCIISLRTSFVVSRFFIVSVTILRQKSWMNVGKPFIPMNFNRLRIMDMGTLKVYYHFGNFNQLTLDIGKQPYDVSRLRTPDSYSVSLHSIEIREMDRSKSIHRPNRKQSKRDNRQHNVQQWNEFPFPLDSLPMVHTL